MVDAATTAIQEYLLKANLASHSACPKADTQRILAEVLKSLGPILYLATEPKPTVNPKRICVKTGGDAFSVLRGNDVMFTNGKNEVGVMAGPSKPLVLDDITPDTVVRFSFLFY